MDSTETTMARELFHQIMQTKRSLHAGMTDILADAPRCHFDMLHRLYSAIQHSGREGAVPVSELNCRMYDSPHAVSRALRILEQDALIRREPDPDDPDIPTPDPDIPEGNSKFKIYILVNDNWEGLHNMEIN